MLDPAQAALIRRYVQENPRQPGFADARLAQSGVAVWALVAYQRAVGSLDVVAHDYDLPVQEVEAAFAYYQRHQPTIDARITASTLPGRI